MSSGKRGKDRGVLRVTANRHSGCLVTGAGEGVGLRWENRGAPSVLLRNQSLVDGTGAAWLTGGIPSFA